MAGELVHISVGTELEQIEFEGKTLHQFNSQAVGDIAYASSTTQMSRLAKGANGDSLTLASGVPAWNTEVQSNVTASRVLGTVYQNTSGRPLYVLVTLDVVGGAGNLYTAIAYTDTNTPPTTVVGKSSGCYDSEVDFSNIGFFVLPGSYYKVTEVSQGELETWFEWEI